MNFPHIASNDSRCWCGPKVLERYETVSHEIFPGIFTWTGTMHYIVVHYEPSMHTRQHGRPLKPRYIAEFRHI